MQINQILKENVNVNKTKTNNVKRYNVTGEQVHAIAQKLCDLFSDQGSHDYFCKVAWQLPEYIIMNNVEAAQKGRQPVRLFTWLCNQSISKSGLK
jgi:hypothetical protein